MARLQLIIPLLLWGIWHPSDSTPELQWASPVEGTLAYFAAVLAVVAWATFKARLTMRRTTVERADAVPRFHRAAFVARWTLIFLHGVALWYLGYGEAVMALAGPAGRRFPSLPAALSILPVVSAWIGLMAAQYPLDRAVREQNAVYAFEFGEPVHPVPSKAAYVLHGVRSQVLFTLVPLVVLAVLRDCIAWGAISLFSLTADTAEWLSTFGALILVVVLSPELLRRVLPTTPLPPSAVRDRLLGLSRHLRLGVRDVLLWHTHFAAGNAAVMGVVPGVRYVMMTDLLLQSMPPEQVEAVFAHEAGHVVHRHIAWYIAFWVAMVLWLEVIGQYLARTGMIGAATVEWIVPSLGLAAVVVAFGWLSRGFERQADAFAARWIGRSNNAEAQPADGSAVFAAALRSVARMNNLPLDLHGMIAGRPLLGRLIGRMVHHGATWLHGGIRSRIHHVAALTHDATAAKRFRIKMIAVRVAIGGLLATAILTTVATQKTQARRPADRDGTYSEKTNSTSTDALRGSALTPTAARA